MAEIPYKERKWLALPPIPEPNAKYFIVSEDGKYFRFFITTAFGDLVELDVSAASVTTLKFFLGVGVPPVGYIQKSISTILQDAALVDMTIQGFMLVNGTPYEPVAAGIDFDAASGTLDLSVFGQFYEGAKIVVMVSK